MYYYFRKEAYTYTLTPKEDENFKVYELTRKFDPVYITRKEKREKKEVDPEAFKPKKVATIYGCRFDEMMDDRGYEHDCDKTVYDYKSESCETDSSLSRLDELAIKRVIYFLNGFYYKLV